MKKILIACFCSLFTIGLQAQSYMTAAGLRVGNTVGLTVNQRILKKWSIEGIIQNDLGSYTSLTGLAKRHVAVFSRGANIYFGGGAHTGFGEQRAFGGIDGIFGIELTIMRVNISLDAKPAIHVGNNNVFDFQTAVSVRYVLWKTSSQQRKKWRQKKKDKKKKNKAQSGGGLNLPLGKKL